MDGERSALEREGNPLPTFPLEITVKLADESGLIFGELTFTEAVAVDEVVRRAMIVGFDACLTAVRRGGVDSALQDRERLATLLLGGV